MLLCALYTKICLKWNMDLFQNLQFQESSSSAFSSIILIYVGWLLTSQCCFSSMSISPFSKIYLLCCFLSMSKDYGMKTKNLNIYNKQTVECGNRKENKILTENSLLEYLFSIQIICFETCYWILRINLSCHKWESLNSSHWQNICKAL